MEDEDEEVIFENSALHQALITGGCTDIETEPRFLTELKYAHLNDEDTSIEEDQDTTTVSHSSFAPHLTFSSLTDLFIPAEVLDRLSNQQQSVTLNHLVNSHVLSKEDQSFLQYFIEDIDHSEFPCLELNRRCILVVAGILAVFLLALNWLLIWNLPASFILTVISAHYMPCIGEYICLLCAALFNVLVIACFFLLWVLVKNIINNQILKELRAKDVIFQQLEVEAWELLHLEKKCLRLIKETELVARGFILATQHRVASSSNHVLSEVNNPWCSQLRQTLLCENINLMSLIKAYMIKMMQNFPMVCQDTDFSSLETMSYESFYGYNRGIGKDFQEQNMDLEKRDHNFDLLSTARLSKSVSLLHVYISGLIRRLALCFYEKNLKDKSIEPFSATKECVRHSINAIQKTKVSLNHFYTFAQALNRCIGEKSPSNMASRSDEFETLYSCVRSTSVHLSNAFEQNEKMKNLLEKRADQAARIQSGIDQGDPTEVRVISEEDKAAFRETMKQLKESLDSCSSSYKMTMRLLNAKSIAESPEKTKHTESERPAQRMEPVVRYIAAQENVIVDQVFEAVVTEVDGDLVQRNRSSQQGSEDQAKTNEVKETFKMFSKELHTVVEKRAVTRQAREEMALARSRGDNQELLSSPSSQSSRPQSLNLSEQQQGTEDLSSRASSLSVKSNPESELSVSSVDSAGQLLLASGETTDSDLSFQPQRHKEKCLIKQHESPRKRENPKAMAQLSDDDEENMEAAVKSPKRPKPKPRKHNYNQKLEADVSDGSSMEIDSCSTRPSSSASMLSSSPHFSEDKGFNETFGIVLTDRPLSKGASETASSSLVPIPGSIPIANDGAAESRKSPDDSDAFRDLIFEPAPRDFQGDEAAAPEGTATGLSQREEYNVHEVSTCHIRSSDLGCVFTKNLAHSAASKARAMYIPGAKEELFGDDCSSDSSTDSG